MQVTLSPGNKVFAKRVFIMDDNGNQYEFAAGRGKAFALILMDEEKPSPEGIGCDDFLRSAGWELPDA